jgi:hypothetical protein
MTQEQLNEIVTETAKKHINNMPKDVLHEIVRDNTSYFREMLRGQYLDTATNDDLDLLYHLSNTGLQGDTIDDDMMQELNDVYQRAIDNDIYDKDDQDEFVEWVEDLRYGRHG